MTPEQYRARTAFHEAGHACAARALRVGVRSVSIVPDEASGGRVEHNPLRRPLDYWGSLRDQDRIAAHILVCWAGPLAETKAVELWTGHFAHRPAHDDDVDLRFIVDASRGLMSSDRTALAYRELMKLRALDLIETPLVWAQITAVACALWEHVELTGRRFHAICREVEQATG